MNDRQAATARAAALTPDICIIGAGPGGIALATAAAAFGVSVVLIDRAAMGGARETLRRAALRAAAAEGSFAEAVAHVRRTAASLAANESAQRMGALGITVLTGEARFASRSTVRVKEQEIKARRFVIATGSEPRLPAIEGLEAVAPLTFDSLLDLPRCPERLVILGTDAEAVELVQAMARLSSTVSLVAADTTLLPGEDPEAVGLVRRALLRDGIAVYENAAVERVERARSGVIVTGTTATQGEFSAEGTHLLVAFGRRPAIASLELELAGVSFTERGVKVDASLRTQNRRIFAIGDCIDLGDGGRHGPSAASQASLVLRRLLFRLPTRFVPHLAPRLVGCAPEIASVGPTEAQALARHKGTTVLRWPYAEIAQAQAEGRSEGFLKIIADSKGRVLGATIVGARAGDLITPWCLAVQKGLTVQDMAGAIVPSPSFSEISVRAATSFYTPMATRPGLKRLIGFLRRFG